MGKRLSKIIVIAALTGAMTAGAASASDMLRHFDANGDGTVTRIEARDAVRAHFRGLDLDANGVVTKDERRADRRDRRFERMDTNRDGVVTYDELQNAATKRAQKRFSDLDANRDGVVTREEADLAKKRRGARGPMTLQDLDARVMRMFDRADRDRNGVISPDEAAGLASHDRRG